MPLCGGATASEQHERKLRVGLFGKWSGRLANETGAAVGMVEAAIFEKPAFVGDELGAFGEGPLDPAALVQHRVIADARDVAGLARRKALYDLEDLLRSDVVGEKYIEDNDLDDAVEDDRDGYVDLEAFLGDNIRS